MSARYLNLPRPCNYYSPPCFDGDGIPDTPPCWEDYPNDCSHLYDSTCDTPNRQNIMFALNPCNTMFTYGQGQYMQYVLQIDIGNRDSLVTQSNFLRTGMNDPMPDMPPVADFSVKNNAGIPTYFFCENENVHFYNESWNDTITAVSWTFSNSASTLSSTSLTSVINKFFHPGWVKVTLAATGNNSGTTTLTNARALYIADTTPTNGMGYYQEFNGRGALYQWPVFNYFKNNFNWQLANVGYYDDACLVYTGYDTRGYPENLTGTPAGDIDDIFTPVFDLTGFTGNCYLNFMSSGATATSDPTAMKDSLEIDYSVDLSNSWHRLKAFSGNVLDNKGSLNVPYVPLWMGDWVPQAIPIPANVRERQTIFRFRYYPGTDSLGNSTGNNFYIDRINFNAAPESVAAIDNADYGISLLPNPTHGDAFVIIKDKTDILTAKILVTDIAGKIVYEANSNNNINAIRLEIPASATTSKGLYLVHIITYKWNKTEKLLVY